MPELNGVTVHVNSASGKQTAQEFGVQHLRSDLLSLAKFATTLLEVLLSLSSDVLTTVPV